MKIKKIYRFIAILLLVALNVQPMQVMRVKASGGAVVTGTSGTQYTLDHQYIKQLNIGTGNITITDTSYTQTNGSSESWDAVEDAYVIKGQGTSTNSITINNVGGAVVNIYLVETSWNGQIYSTYGNVNIIICGAVVNKGTNGFLAVHGQAKNTIKVVGLDDSSNVDVDYFLSGALQTSDQYTIEINHLNVAFKFLMLGDIENLTVNNSTLTGKSFSNKTTGRVYYTFTINDSTISNLFIDSHIVGLLDVNRSNLYDFRSLYYNNIQITDSYLNTVTLLADSASMQKDIQITRSNLVNFDLHGKNGPSSISTTSKLIMTDSSIGDSLYLVVGSAYLLGNSSSSIIFDAISVSEDASNLFRKMIRFRDHPNTYILTTFPDGKTSKLLTDGNGYLYPYVPTNSTSLQFQITDETGGANLGNYELNFDPVTSNDVSYSDPEAMSSPTITSQSPANVSLLKGNAGNIYVNASPGNPGGNLEFQWYKDGTILTGKTSNVLPFTSSDEADEGVYTCVVTEEGVGSTTSSPITVTVLEGNPESVFEILAWSSNKTVTEDSTTELYVIPSVIDNVTFQWKKNGINIPGATTSKYTITSVKELDEGTYTCVLTKGGEVVTSNPIVLTVEPNPLAGDVNSLQEAVNALTIQINALQVQLVAANNSLSALQSTIDTLTGQINDLNAQITLLQNQINDLSGNVASLQGEVNLLKSQKNDLQIDLDDANTEKANLQIIVSDLNIEVINKASQITILQNLLDASEANNEDLRNQISTLNTQISTMITQIETLTNEVAVLNADKEVLHNQLNTANTTISNLQQQIIDLINENDDLKSQLDAALLQIIILQGQVNSLTTQNTSLVNQVSDLEGQIIVLQDLLDGAGNDTVELLQQISDLTTQVTNLTTIINQKDSHITTLNEQITNLNLTIVNLQTEVSNALDSLSEYEGAILQDKINQILAENTKLKNDYVTLSQEKTLLLTQIEALNTIILNLQNENSSLLQQLQDAENLINSLQSDLVIEINKSTTLQTQVDTLNNQIILLQNQLGQAENDKDTLNLQIIQLQGDLLSLTNLLNVSNQTIADLTLQITDLNNTITALQTQIINALSQLSEYEGNNLLEKIQDIKNKQVSITADLNEANALNNSLNSQLDSANTQLLSLQHQIDLLTGQLNDKDAKITELLALLAEKDVIITEKNVQISNLQNQVLTLQDTIDVISGGNDTIIELTNQVNQLMNQINILNSKVSELNGIIADKDVLISNLNSQLVLKNTEINNLLKQIDDLMNAGGNQEQILKLQEEITKLTNQLDQAHTVISDLQKQLEDLKKNPITIIVPTDPVKVEEKDEIVDQSTPETIIKEVSPDKVENVVVNPVISTKQPEVIAQEGWELSTSLDKDAVWFESLLPTTEGYTGVFTFFDNGLNVDAGVKGAALTVGYNGIPNSGLVDTKDGYMKYTFYARKVSNVNNIYICSVDMEKEEYTTPVTKITSSILKEPRSFTPENTYHTLADKPITLKLSADYGSYGKAGVMYQIVPEHLDFDPDGTWVNVGGNTLTIPKQATNFRVYIKFMDKNGNYTVDKTVGFKVSEDEMITDVSTDIDKSGAPVFTMYKTIYLGYDYQVQLANVTGKVSYTSSNSKIAKVSKNGVITSVAEGKAIITCTVKDKVNYTYQFVVTIADGKGSPTLNLITPKIQTTEDAPVLMMYKQVKAGASTKLEIRGLSNDTKVTYINADSSIAYIFADGTIKGLTKGSTDVLAIVTQGGLNYIYYIKVRVDDGTLDSEMWSYLSAA